eukprot:COSAG01_NODE_1865_length_9036_cov_6.511022_1_plen_71_part_10
MSDADITAMSALALSMVFVGQCREDQATPMLEALRKHQVDTSAAERVQEARVEARDKRQGSALYRFQAMAL